MCVLCVYAHTSEQNKTLIRSYNGFGVLIGATKPKEINFVNCDGTEFIDTWHVRGESRYARWATPDPLADKYYSTSPYAFCNNNPVNFVDPDGRFVWPEYLMREIYGK